MIFLDRTTLSKRTRSSTRTRSSKRTRRLAVAALLALLASAGGFAPCADVAGARAQAPSSQAPGSQAPGARQARGSQARGTSARPPGANEAVSGEILIVLASSLPGLIDPRIADVPALRRPPFDSYGSMALLSSPSVRFRVGQAEEIALPNGRRMRLVLREITPEGRYRLQISINRPGQQDYLPAMTAVTSPGDPVFIAGQSFQAGTLVIGIRLGE